MLTATKDLMLPTTVTGSWPRPRWYTGGLFERPYSTALSDVDFREQHLDAVATVISRPGARRAGHPDERRLPPRLRPGGPFVVLVSQRAAERRLRVRHRGHRGMGVPDRHLAQRDRRRLEVPRNRRQGRAAGAARVRQGVARRAVADGEARQVRHDRRRPRLDGAHDEDRRLRRRQARAHVGHRHRPQRRAPAARRGRVQGRPDRGAGDSQRRRLGRRRGDARLLRRPLQLHGRRARQQRSGFTRAGGTRARSTASSRPSRTRLHSRSSWSASTPTSGRSSRSTTGTSSSRASPPTRGSSTRRSPWG